MIPALLLAGCGVGIAAPQPLVDRAEIDHGTQMEDVATVAGKLQLEIMLLDEEQTLTKPIFVQVRVPAPVKEAMQQCALEQQGMIVLGEAGHGHDGPLRQFVRCTMETLHRSWLGRHLPGEII